MAPVYHALCLKFQWKATGFQPGLGLRVLWQGSLSSANRSHPDYSPKVVWFNSVARTPPRTELDETGGSTCIVASF
jgi:hypothetical protein